MNAIDREMTELASDPLTDTLEEMVMNKRMALLGAVLTIAAVGQIILSFLLYNQTGTDWLTNVGWFVLAISGVFGWLPIYTFRKKGGVARGKSYVQTTELVDSGLYSIVRHPQYLAGVLMSLALALIAQNWLVAVLGVVAAATCYASAVFEEQSLVAKFGTAYQDYMQRVPRMNAVLGIIRQLSRRSSKGGQED